MDKKKIIASFAVLVVMSAIIINPSEYILSAQNGIMLFGMTVLPALFPFFFFSKLLGMFEGDIAMGEVLHKPLKSIYNAPPAGGYIFVMSIMCGYPIGAKLISEYYNENIIDEQDAKSLAALASTGGPLFILGTIGAIILKNHNAAIIILISHYLSALINGLIYRNRLHTKSVRKPSTKSLTLKDSIYNSVISILLVGGFIIVFNIICDVMVNFKILSLITKSLTPIFGSITEGALMSIIEVTRGCLVMGSSSASIIQKTASMCAAVTFGGLSIIIQSITFLESAKVRTSQFILMKLTQCIIAYVIALSLAMVFLS